MPFYRYRIRTINLTAVLSTSKTFSWTAIAQVNNTFCLTISALVAITWLTTVDEIKPAAAEPRSRGSINRVVAINSTSNPKNLGRQLSAILIITGAGVFSWFALRHGKEIFNKHFFSQKNLKQAIIAERSPSIDKNIKEQDNQQPDIIDIARYIKRANSYFQQGDSQKAIEEFNTAISFNPHSAYLYSARANFRRKNLGDKEGAIEDYSKAIEIHPQNALFYLWRSQTYNGMGEQSKAIEDYNTAIRLAPEATMYHYSHDVVNSEND